MVNSFGNREKGFEAKFKLDQEIEFQITARRNKLLGLWLAEKLGLNETMQCFINIFFLNIIFHKTK